MHVLIMTSSQYMNTYHSWLAFNYGTPSKHVTGTHMAFANAERKHTHGGASLNGPHDIYMYTVYGLYNILY